MNDRFKFRVWDKTENMYHYDAECAYDYMGGTPPLMDVSFGDVLCNDDYIIEQCTGLKDKNGKLIYEGDVIEFYIGVSPVYVQWNSDKCCFVLKRFNVKGWEISLIQDDIESRYTIIGNIHDNEMAKLKEEAE